MLKMKKHIFNLMKILLLLFVLHITLNKYVDTNNIKVEASTTEVVATSTNEVYSEGLEFTLNIDGTSYSVTGIGTCTDTDIVIPNTYEGLPVTSIGKESFRDCSNITSVTILEGVVNIGSLAFYNCNSLINVIIPDNLMSIGDSAFKGCSSIASIKIPKNLKSIENGVFEGCKSLVCITLPDNLMSIGASAFRNCSNLINIEIPEGVTGIGRDAFSCCISLTNVNIPKNLKSIEIGVFEGCKSLVCITLPDNLMSIGAWAFKGCNSITSITIPNSVTSIGVSAFEGCSSITSITIPSSVTNIERYAFSYCSSLQNVYYEGTIEDLCKINFEDSTSNPMYYAKTFYMLNTNNEWCEISEIEIPNTITSIGNCQFYGFDNLNSIILSDNLISIGDYAFTGCNSLTNITIPSSVTSIGISVFSGCNSITSITIPSSVTSIGDYAFSGCSSITSITIPSSVTSIGDYAFSGCSSITSITIPSSVTNIERYAFSNCSSLQNVYYEGTIEDWCNITFAYSNANPMGNAEHFYILDDNNKWYELKEIEIPNTITSIGNCQFYGFDNLISIIIPEGVTSVGNYAFSGCSNLASVIIPEGVISIGNYAFNACTGLKSIIIPEGVTSVGNCAFSGCSNLTDVIILEGVTSIGRDTFRNCSSLTSIILPNSVTSIGISAFSGCSNLTDITILEGVTSIGNEAFYNCNNLSLIVINSEVIASSIITDFSCCGYLCNYAKTILIDSSITNIGSSITRYFIYVDTLNVVENGTSVLYNVYSKHLHKLDSGNLELLEDGNYECNICNVVILGHTCEYGNWYVSSEPTKESSGLLRRECIHNSEHYEEIVLEPLNNSSSFYFYSNILPTCIASGKETYSYMIDNITFTFEVEIDAIGHSMTGVEEVLATCETSGHSAYTKCTNDECNYVEGYEYYEALGHAYGDWIIEKNPTIDETGLLVSICSYNVDHYKTIELEVLNNTSGFYDYEMIDSNCTNEGKHIYKYIVDGTEFSFEEIILIDENKHIEGNWIVTVEATHNEVGYKKCECSLCGTYFNEGTEIPKIPHEYEEIIVSPTCNEKGYTLNLCSCGDSYITNIVNCIEHSFGAWIEEDIATCEKMGKKVRHCIYDGCLEEEIEITDKLQHDYVYDNALEAFKCNNCGDSYGAGINAGSSYVEFIKEYFIFKVNVSDITTILNNVNIVNDYTGEVLDFTYELVEENVYKVIPNNECLIEGYSYTVTLSGDLTFVDYIGNRIIVTIKETNTTKETKLNEDIILINEYEAFELGDSGYQLELKDIDKIEIGNILCISNATSLEEIASSSSFEILNNTYFGKVSAYFKTDYDTYIVILETPELHEILSEVGYTEAVNVDFDNLTDENGNPIDLDALANSFSLYAADYYLNDSDFLEFLSIINVSSSEYATENGFTIGKAGEANIEFKGSFSKKSSTEFCIGLTIKITLPMKSSTGKDLGKIEINFKIENDIALSVDADLLALLPVLFNFELEQVTTKKVTLDVKYSFDYSLADASKPYVLNTNTGKLHRSTCYYVKNINDDNIQKLSSNEFKEKKNTYQTCKYCTPENDEYLDTFWQNTNSQTLHSASSSCSSGCEHGIDGWYLISSYEVQSLVNNGYNVCSICTPNYPILDFKTKLMNDLKYSDWGKTADKIKDMSDETGLTSFIKSLGSKIQNNNKKDGIDVRLGHLSFAVGVFVIELDISLVANIEISAQAIFEYESRETTTYEIKKTEAFGGLTTVKSVGAEGDYTTIQASFIGKIESNVGVEFDLSVSAFGILGIGGSLEVGAYMDISGIIHLESTDEIKINDGTGEFVTSRETSMYFGSKIAIGVYYEASIYVELLEFKLTLVSTDRQKTPLWSWGYDKIYYTYTTEEPIIELIDDGSSNWNDLANYQIEITYLDINTMESKTEKIYLKDTAHYNINYSIITNDYYSLLGSTLYEKEYIPNTTLILTLDFEGLDEWKKYEEGNVAMFLPNDYEIKLIVKNHNWQLSEELSIKETCTQYGENVYICSDCGKINSISIKPYGHSGGEATCTEGKICTICETEYTSPNGHTGGTATCTSKKECTVCGDFYGSYASCIFNTLPYQIDDATCSTPTTYYYHCTNLECDKIEVEYTDAYLEHTEVVLKAIDATCTTYGYTEGLMCSVCNEVLIHQQKIDKLNHIYKDGYCIFCNKAEIHVHSYIELTDEYVPATCTTNGIIKYQCSDVECAHTYTEYIVAPGHDESIKTYGYDPTCIESGLTDEYYCIVCGVITKKQAYISPLGHESTIVPSISPTCTTTGLTTGTSCSRCNEILVKQQEIDALGHIEIIDAAIDPTCTTTGLTQGIHCGRCYETLVYQRIIYANGHTYEKNKCKSCDDIKYATNLEFEYNEDKTAYIVTSIGECNYEYVWIPSVYLGLPVIEIKALAFENCTQLKEIYIPTTISKINYLAFAGCTNLTYIALPNGLKEIGDAAFRNCVSLENVELPNRLTHISDMLFKDCTSLKTIAIPNNVISISNYAFDGCISLETIIIPSSVTSLGSYAFNNCTNLKNINISNNIETIESHTFNGCISLETIIIPSSVTNLGSYVFNNCTNLINVNMSKGVKTIDNYAFNGCTNLKTITLPSTITYIGNAIFNECNNLTSVVLPFIGEEIDTTTSYYISYLFGGISTNDNSILMPSSLKKVEVIGGNITINAFANCDYLETIIIGNNVDTIGDYAFSDCSNLINVEISNHVEEIGTSIFNNCVNLKGVKLSNQIKVIEANLFKNCISLETIDLPEGVTHINYGAFRGCTNLTNVYIPSTITNIELNVFYNNSNLVYNEYDNAKYLGNLNNPYLVLMEAIDSSVVSCDVHDNTKIIQNSAFRNCMGLQSVTLPEGLKIIDSDAFNFCIHLHDIMLPNSLVEIRNGAFSQCHYIKEITLSNKVIYIGENAFYDNKLISLNIPQSVEFIGEKAFISSTLESIVVDENNLNYKSVDGSLYTKDGTILIQYANGKSDISYEIIDGTLTIGKYAFYKNKLQEVLIPKSVTTIEEYAFYYCSDLSTIRIPESVIDIKQRSFYACTGVSSIIVDEKNSVYDSRNNCNAIIETISKKLIYGCSKTIILNDITNIDSYAFNYCSNLENIIIPKSVIYIGYYAFSECNNLKEVVMFDNEYLSNGVSHNIFTNCTSLEKLIFVGTSEAWKKYNIALPDGCIVEFVDSCPHKLTKWIVDVEATCIVDGLKHQVCNHCDELYVEEVILAHHEEIIVEGYDSTYNTTGLTDGIICGICGEVLVEQTIIAKKELSEDFKIRSAYLNLNQDINVVYRTTVPEGYEDFYMIFTFRGKQYKVETYTIDANGRYCFRFNNVMPQFMNENISACLYATIEDEEVFIEHSEYSVKAYCVNMLGKLENNETNKEVIALISDLLVYGAAAQKYLGHNENNFVTNGLTLNPTIYEMITDAHNKQAITGDASKDVYWQSAGLFLENSMALRMGFKVSDNIDLEKLKVVVSINGRITTYEVKDLTIDANGIYRIYYRGINATEFEDVVTAYFVYNDEEIGQTLEYSVNTYVYKKQSGNDILAEVVQAIYNYGASAKAYSEK